ncbi:helix-turn-helix domain-containing protein [Limoniibacter endophyticus]|uniref:helix-turn-helix domain-containing protein n=1 Tax=Limoniibacter endophyticus TaxID=1565040 RepID=UPI0027E510A3|nr:helix-turn-helix domain-containing protein [Limoniibacter endophyticus]
MDGEKIAALCREFGISRKTGHKIISRCNDSGLEGLTKSVSPSLPSRQSASFPDRGSSCASGRTNQPGCAEDQGAAGAALSGRP